MSSAALGLVLAAALLHATWNLAVKGVSDGADGDAEGGAEGGADEGADRVAFVWVYVVASAALWVPIAVVWVVAAGTGPTGHG